MYKRFEELMASNHMTPADLCKATGIKSNTFSEWKKGKSVPKTDKLILICKALHTSVEYLWTGEDPEKFFSEPFQADPEFMQYVRRFWQLPDQYKEAVFKAIRHEERDYFESLEEQKKKESVSAS